MKCTHGAAVGQLDEDAIFYLRARGLDLQQARDMLIFAFAGDVLNRIRIDGLDFDKGSANIVVANCFEATENGSSEEPNCIFTSGFLAGIFAEVLDKTVQAKEVRCMSQGATECEFQISLVDAIDGQEAELPKVDLKNVDGETPPQGEAKPGSGGGSTDSKSAIGTSEGSSENQTEESDTAEIDAGVEKAARIAKHKQHFWNKFKKE